MSKQLICPECKKEGLLRSVWNKAGLTLHLKWHKNREEKRKGADRSVPRL
jgi:hypothetical protein